MQITLKQAELESAVRDFIAVTVSRPVGEITFSATRGTEGIITTIEVGQTPAVSEVSIHDIVEKAADALKETPEEVVTEKAEAPEEEAIPDGKRLFG